jgi:SAM-dependent methyltransferase
MSGFYSRIARFYDAENQGKDDDIALYLRLAEQYGEPIIDIGCGTGRVMIPLAEAGYTVNGIDNEQAMLDRVERGIAHQPGLAEQLVLHHGDVRDYKFAEPFKLTLVPYNGLMHFHTQDEQLRVLRQLRRWTHDDGLMVLDLPNAGEVFATEETDALMFERTFLEPETGHMVMQMSNSYLDRTAQLLHVTWIYDEITADGIVHRTTAPLLLYYYFFSELRLLLRATGWQIEAVFGDTDLGPYEDGCERMIVFAKPETT